MRALQRRFEDINPSISCQAKILLIRLEACLLVEDVEGEGQSPDNWRRPACPKVSNHFPMQKFWKMFSGYFY
jgi:hypothetical protein